MHFGVVIALLVSLAVISGLKAIKQVPQGFQWTIERFGRYTKTLGPGLSIIVPFIDQVGAKLLIMEQVADIPSQEIISKDNAMVKVDGVIFFQVTNPAKAAYEINDLDFAMRNMAMTNIRTVLGSLDLDEMLSQRDHINTKLLDIMDEITATWGVKVTRVEIKDIRPPQNLVDAMAGQMKAEREKRSRILEAEGIRQSQILTAEGDKAAAILTAEGAKAATILTAEARERQAQAEATSTEMVSKAVEKGDLHALNYLLAQQYVKAIAGMAQSPNQKMVFMPMESSGLISSLGGISELVKDVFNSKDKTK